MLMQWKRLCRLLKKLRKKWLPSRGLKRWALTNSAVTGRKWTGDVVAYCSCCVSITSSCKDSEGSNKAGYIEDVIQEALSSLDVSTPAKEMKKRGLVSQGNTCFQNVIMQSVLACPPFLNLFVEISTACPPTTSM
uniref:Uncharacterized protein n=1 Tax=Peronospora matthiolae TaxID=2874970 RepID=A0AAV1U3M3_9STRA